MKFFLGGVGYDYKSGPYHAVFAKGDTAAEFCIDIYDDNLLEMDEAFRLEINDTSLPDCITIGSPSVARIIIMDNECTYLIFLYLTFGFMLLQLST